MIRLLHEGTLTEGDYLLLASVGESLDYDYVIDRIESGHAKVFYAHDDDTLLVTEIDREFLVILALVGYGAVEIMQTLLHIARCKGLSAVWFKTKRRGLARMIRHLDPQPFEDGYRVTV